MASLWASMRLHLYQCGKQFGIEEKDRAVKFEVSRDRAIEQQLAALEMASCTRARSMFSMAFLRMAGVIWIASGCTATADVMVLS